MISIHVPARGTTIPMPPDQWLQMYFNPRTRTGYDIHVPGCICRPVLFQSTYPHGVRPCTDRLERSIKFQSTYPHGVRPAVPTLSITGQFQSTYPHGVRPSRCDHRCSDDFNPRTRTGYDTDAMTIQVRYFNPRTRTGTT